MGQPVIINDRFELHEHVGVGGMGIVYRATDRQTQTTVAVKTLTPTDAKNASRFAREATILAGLNHPNVVSYIDHGITEDGKRFLVMEWLDGCDLGEYLNENETLSIQDTLQLAEQVALALGRAHKRGIIHRDIKPSNIFLLHNDPAQVRVLDFGIARLARPSQWLTRPGVVIGSPGYMAPEQARGDMQLSPRADIFSLGCVVYHALVGESPFYAAAETAVLAKILFSDAPRARHSRSDVPPMLDNLVAQMLEKDPSDRPAVGAELAELIAAVDLTNKQPVTVTATPPRHLTHGERRVVSIVLAGANPTQKPTPDDVATRVDDETRDASATIVDNAWFELELLDARVEVLANGCLVACLSDTGVPTDQAIRAAQCAQMLQQLMPSVPIVLATGHGELDEGLPTGDIIDRAVAQLGSADPGVIRMGRDTASLIRSRFSVKNAGSHWVLGNELDVASPFHTVLGQRTMCVGRNRELDLLRSTFQSVHEDRTAEAVLLTAPAGAGKTRIIHEFLLSLKADPDSVQVLMGQANPLSEGSAFSLLSVALRHTAGIRKGEPLDQQQMAFRLRMQRHLPKSKDTTTVGFLSELAGISSTNTDDIELRQARHAPRLMGDQLLAAWTDWLTAECQAKTTLLVLDDVHWGDAASVGAVLMALSELANLPLMVLCGARPEGESLFPSLWSSPIVTHLRLRQLSTAASTQLVRSVLRDQLNDTQVKSLVRRADGNAFFLEELIRAAGEGAPPDTLPKTVLGMLQSRLDALTPQARRVMRAASVFGDVFWLGGVEALLGEQRASSEVVRGWLADLQDRELLFERTNSAYRDETEYSFRHDLIRVATYNMLTDDDRELGHRLAGEWLEAMGQCDPETLARHFEFGGRFEHAVGYYVLAAEHAAASNDLQDVVRCTEAGIRCGASGETLGRFQLARTEAQLWNAEMEAARKSIGEALTNIDVGSFIWMRAVGFHAGIAIRLGFLEEALPHINAVIEVLKSKPEFYVDGIISLARITTQLGHAGRGDLFEWVAVAIEEMRPLVNDDEPLLAAYMSEIRYRRLTRKGRHAQALPHLHETARLYRLAGDIRYSLATEGNLAYCLLQLGHLEEVIQSLTTFIERTMQRNLTTLAALAKNNLGIALTLSGKHEEAVTLQKEGLERHMSAGDVRYVTGTYGYLSHCLWKAGQLDEAKKYAVMCRDSPHDFPSSKAGALAVLAQVALARGDLDESLALADQGMAILQKFGSINTHEWDVRLAHAQVVIARGNVESIQEALLLARTTIQNSVAAMPDEKDRTAFLSNLPPVVTLRALAKKWLDGVAG